jgi:hypothetical protein
MRRLTRSIQALTNAGCWWLARYDGSIKLNPNARALRETAEPSVRAPPAQKGIAGGMVKILFARLLTLAREDATGSTF